MPYLWSKIVQMAAQKATAMSKFIELRRKNLKITKEDVATAMKLDPKSYPRKLRTVGFTESEIIAAARLLQFDIIFIPKEADIFTA